MVRGRRARAHETIPSSTAAAAATTTTITLNINGSQFADDHYCASPKRKDCRIDTKKLSNKLNSKQNGSTKLSGNSTSSSGIGVSGGGGGGSGGGHQRQIKDMFRAISTRSKALRNTSSDIKCSELNNDINKDLHKNEICNKLNNFDENHITNGNNDEILLYSNDIVFTNGDIGVIVIDDEENYPDLEDEQRTLNTNNIFLQEPVLSLNVDKSPNQPSSIKINKTLEVNPVFPSNNFHINLNGQFNKIVTLSTSPQYDNEIIKTPTHTTTNSILLNNDSNSCDSGVVIDAINQGRQRKPATPHRILCPSPVKHCPVVVDKSSLISATTAFSSSSSSTSSISTINGNNNSSYQNTTASACHPNAQQKRHSKSRRRLNAKQKHSENNSMASPQIVGGIILSKDALRKINNGIVSNNTNKSNNNNLPNSNPNSQEKAILNSVKKSISDQNTNTNHMSNGIHNNQQKRNNGQHIKLPSNVVTFDNNKKLTDYFPVRRSVRKTKKVMQEEIMQNIEKAIIEGREDGLKVVEYFKGKGRGVVAKRTFERGEFVVEYIGDLITMSEANQREKKYSLDENAGCYMYYFKHKNQQYCIDATAESGKLGRLVNHSRNGNLITKVVEVKNRPHLVLIAKDDIQPDEELTYDYGDRSKESLLHHPWLAL